MSNEAIRIYWAGGLFDHKELIGNLQLADAVRSCSEGRYIVSLPQNGDAETSRDALSIRNADLQLLISCDALVANFDGTELDSGTVVEYCVAKSLDIPVVLMRTDFRNCGDTTEIPWNLMCAGWPRTSTLLVNGMAEYQRILSEEGDIGELTRRYHKGIAGKIIQALNDVLSQESWLTAENALEQYCRVVKSAGSGLDKLLTRERLSQIVLEKTAKGIF